MILKGSQRAGAKQLAFHLLKTEENEHVEVHELRGFLSTDLPSALHEAYAVSRGTRCRQFLFSLSLNPPPDESVAVKVFEAAIEQIEQKLGLNGQPRAIVFHEKEGRRHAHAVWSRIASEKMRAINLPYFKMKLRDISKELYLEHGWQMPRGLVDSKERDPLNFSRAEWQQARRAGHDPKALRTLFQECWAISDSRAAFAKALEERGYYLCRGDRRGFVALDFRGEVYAIAKYASLRTKQVKAKLGDPKALPSVGQTRTLISARMTNVLKGYIAEADTAFKKQSGVLAFKRSQMAQRQRADRRQLLEAQEVRRNEETKQRAQRLSRGFRGLWDRLTGKYQRIRRQNEYEAYKAYQRDQSEKEAQIKKQLTERRTLQKEVAGIRQGRARETAHLHRDIAHYMRMNAKEPPRLRDLFRDANPPRHKGLPRPSHEDGFEPEI